MDSPKNFYEKNLKIINGLKFTHRQIDVIACLLSGWPHKRIAKYLSISVSTVHSHLDSIAQKLGSASRNNIISFIENSGKEQVIRKYYQNFISKEESDDLTEKINVFKETKPTATKNHLKKLFIFFLGILFLGLSYFIVSYFQWEKIENREGNVHSYFSSPNQYIFLERPKIQKKIKSSFANQTGIRTLILSGIGGSGKTTLARQYASNEKKAFVWEINGETKESTINSLENLAKILAKTKEEKENIKFLKEHHDFEHKEKKLILILRKLLKRQKNWTLLYDNVVSFKEIINYLPDKQDNWGKGKIIITTRNASVENYPLYKKSFVIKVPRFSKAEKYKLFNIILAKKNAMNKKMKEETLDFLEQLPPFPLDLSTAAYYIKDSNISYGEYLYRIKENISEFSKIQEDVLSEFSDYNKTRYSIITITIEELIERNPDFKDLFLFISLLNSQNIPIDFIKRLKSDIVVDKFLHHLRKNSFITNENIISDIKTFSIHRSTQRIIFEYLIKSSFYQESLSNLTDKLIDISDYIHDLTERNELKICNLIFFQLKYLLEKKDIFNNKKITFLFLRMGEICLKLKKLEDSQKYLEKSLFLNQKNNIETADTLVLLGSVRGYLGSYSKEIKLIKKALNIYKAYYQDDHPKIALTKTHLGLAYKYLGQYENAKKSFLSSIRIYENNPQKYFSQIISNKTNLGDVYRYLGHYQQAKKTMEENLKVCFQRYGKNHFMSAWSLMLSGVTYRELGEYEKAEKFLTLSRDIHKRCFPKNNIKIIWNDVFLGNIYADLNKDKKALFFLERSFSLIKNYYGENHYRSGWCLLHLAKLYLKLGNIQKAKLYTEKGLSIFKKYYGKNHIQCAWGFHIMGRILLDEGNIEKSNNFLLSALSIFRKTNHPRMYLCFESLGDLNLKRYKNERSEKLQRYFRQKTIEYYDKSIQIIHLNFPKDFPPLKIIEKKLQSMKTLPCVKDPQESRNNLDKE